ncbi:hypothetical protein B0H13DRAFT_2307103 [Mycena leptocephala]|nr:hypothetical protein B0H13DRAFT_2307103 [Mycena leptocephala]
MTFEAAGLSHVRDGVQGSLPRHFHRRAVISASMNSSSSINFQYFHTCSAAIASRDKDDDEINNHGDDKAADEELGEDAEPQVQENITEESIAALVASQTPLREFQHGRLAVEIARMARISPNDSPQWSAGLEQPPVPSATGDDLSNLIKWRGQLERDVQQLNTPPQFARASDSEEADANAEVVRSDEIPTSPGSSDPTVDILGVEQAPSETLVVLLFLQLIDDFSAAGAGPWAGTKIWGSVPVVPTHELPPVVVALPERWQGTYTPISHGSLEALNSSS